MSKHKIDWGRCIFVAVVVIFIVALGYSTVNRAAWLSIERTDYTVYRAAGQAVLDGTSLYEAHNSRGWHYIYPPPFAILMVPFAKLSKAWGSFLWYVISITGLASALIMSVRMAREAVFPFSRDVDPWTLYEIPLFLASPWLVSGVMRCQVSEFIVWLMIASVYFSRCGRNFLAGTSLASAALIKAFPVALLVYFCWRRQWRFMGAFLFCIVVGGFILPSLVYGWQKNLNYWLEWINLVAGPALSTDDARTNNPFYGELLQTLKSRNQSIEALILTLKVPLDQAKPLLLFISMSMLGAMAWLARKVDSRSELMLASAFVTWNVLIPPVAESHYFGVLIFPLAVLTTIALGISDLGQRRLAIGSLILFFCAALWSSLDENIRLYRILCWSSLMIWLCVLLLVFFRGRNSLCQPAGTNGTNRPVC